jgi:hypothetical protein
LNRKTVRTLYLLATALFVSDLPAGCGSDDQGSNVSSNPQTSTGGYGTYAGSPGTGAGGPIGGMPSGAVSGIGGNGNVARTQCVASLCAPVANGTPCCVGTYGPCGAQVGGQCVQAGGSQGGTTGIGGRTGRGGRTGGGFGGFGNFGGQIGTGGVPNVTGGAPATTGGSNGSGGASDAAAPSDAASGRD